MILPCRKVEMEKEMDERTDREWPVAISTFLRFYTAKNGRTGDVMVGRVER